VAPCLVILLGESSVDYLLSGAGELHTCLIRRFYQCPHQRSSGTLRA
jgi:hypothetical protein